MAKVYYSEEEASQKLGVSIDEVARLAKDGKLRSYQDGPRKMYRVNEVDTLAQTSKVNEETGEIELAPADTASGLSLSDSRTKAPGKEDTVITAEGISIFDSEDLEIEAADPMAKTTITPSLEDQIAAEGAGSGSGLLDLTREKDETSLGGVLDQIDMDGTGAATSAGDISADSLTEASVTPVEYSAPPVYVEMVDAASGAFGGMIVGSTIVMLVLGAVALAAFGQVAPGYVEAFKNNVWIFIVVAAVFIGGCALIGYLTGKAAAERQAALRRA